MVQLNIVALTEEHAVILRRFKAQCALQNYQLKDKIIEFIKEWLEE